MLKKLLLAAFVSTSLGMTACTSTPTSSSNAEASNVTLLQSKTWLLTHIGSQAITASNPAQTPNLQFSTDNRLSGSDGCNRLMGSYTTHKDALSLGQMASTKMLCLDSKVNSAEFTEALSKVSHYQVYNNTLRLMDKNGNVLLRLENLKQPR